VLLFTTARSTGAQIVIRTIRETPLRAQSTQSAIVLRQLGKGVRLTVANLWVDTTFVGVAIREAFPGTTKKPVMGWIAINDIELALRGTQLVDMLKPSIGRPADHPDLPPQVPDRARLSP
jgi:hypothetical protein